ncbi:MAG TPA: phosphotransferase [Actinocrinis sp.]|jgi:Ser/Thr protein kinase RdoA (MazF antagonist)
MSTHLVHGMGLEPAAPDWPALTLAEADALLRRFPEAGGANRVLWRSPRPLSAAGLVRTTRGGRVFVKRHHEAVRPLSGLLEEHGFLAHLRARGAPVVRVLPDEGGATAVRRGGWTYEVHSVAQGEDLYRDAVSWSPFAAPEHARAAGRALARIHDAAAGYEAPARGPLPLVGGFTVFAGDDPGAAVEAYAAARPAVAAELAERPWRADVERWHLPFHARLRPRLGRIAPLWTHNDLHASNLLWSADGARATAVIDFGLADRAFAVHDVAVALERNTIGWLEPAAERRADLDAAAALIEAYLQVRTLSDAERAALPDLLPLCHADYALSEIDYFRRVTQSMENTELAYRYLVDHTAWFTTPAGGALLERIRRVLEL